MTVSIRFIRTRPSGKAVSRAMEAAGFLPTAGGNGWTRSARNGGTPAELWFVPSALPDRAGRRVHLICPTADPTVAAAQIAADALVSAGVAARA